MLDDVNGAVVLGPPSLTAPDELLRLHRGQGMDLFWRESLTCPTEDEYIEMVNNSALDNCWPTLRRRRDRRPLPHSDQADDRAIRVAAGRSVRRIRAAHADDTATTSHSSILSASSFRFATTT